MLQRGNQKGGRREEITTLMEGYERTEQAKELLEDLDHGRSSVCGSLCKSVRLLTGFLTEQCNFMGHLHKLGIVNGTFCRLCGGRRGNSKTPAKEL